MSHIFKEGELAWSPFSGFNKCLIAIETLTHGYDEFFLDGRFHCNDKHPTLLTVEQAAKLGYYPEKKKVKKWIWVVTIDNSVFDITHKHYADQNEYNKATNHTRLNIQLIQKIDSTEIEVEE